MLANRRWQLSRIFSNTGCAVGDRAADHAQHLGGRGLLLERLPGLVEQAHVLDRDHRLVGEGLRRSSISRCREGLDRRAAATAIDADRPRLRAASARPARCGSPCRPGACARIRVRRRRSAARRRRTCTARALDEARWPIDRARRHAGAASAAPRLAAVAEPVGGRRARLIAVREPDHCCRCAPTAGARSARAIASKTGCTSVGELLITRRTSAVAVCCSSASVSSAVRSLDLALQPGVRLLQLRAHLVELLGEALELVAGADLDAVVELAGADPRRAFLQRAQRPHQGAGEEEARRRSRPAGRRRAAAPCAQDRGVERRERLGARRLDEHRPVQRRDRRVRGEHLARPSGRARAGGAGRAGRAARPHLRQRAQVGLLQHQADVGMGDQHAVGIDDVGEARSAPILIRETTSQTNFRLTSAAVTPPPLPAGRAIVM